MYDWKGTEEKAEKVKNTKAYVNKLREVSTGVTPVKP
jgi:hypothetical protein